MDKASTTEDLSTVQSTPKDFWAIVAFDEKQEGYILDQSEDCYKADLLMEVTADDCGMKFFSDGKEFYPSMSVIKFSLKPWSYSDNSGEYDCGIDCSVIDVLWRKENER